MAKKFPIHPANPERICWGCDQFCATEAMACSNERSPHPSELFGDDWLAWGDQQLSGAKHEPCVQIATNVPVKKKISA